MGYLFQTRGGSCWSITWRIYANRFAPSESESEAISYAQWLRIDCPVRTRAQPYLVYLQDSIEDTGQTTGWWVPRQPLPSALLHCEPYVYSEVSLQMTVTAVLTW